MVMIIISRDFVQKDSNAEQFVGSGGGGLQAMCTFMICASLFRAYEITSLARDGKKMMGKE